MRHKKIDGRVYYFIRLRHRLLCPLRDNLPLITRRGQCRHILARDKDGELYEIFRRPKKNKWFIQKIGHGYFKLLALAYFDYHAK